MRRYWTETGVEEEDLREDCLPPVEGKRAGGKRIKSLREFGEEEREAKRAFRRESDTTPDVFEQMRGRR